MTRRWLSMGALALALALALPAGAQNGRGAGGRPSSSAPPRTAVAPAAAVSPETAQLQAAEAAEDLALTRLLAGLRLSAAQMERLLPFLESTQKELRDAEEAARAALAAPEPRLKETRQALLQGQNPSTRAEGQIAEQIRIHAGKIRQLRADRVGSLRRILTSMLSAEQESALGETARSLDARERSTRLVVRAATGSRGGDRGPAAGMARMLDRARGASEANYAQERMAIAQRLMAWGQGSRERGNREAAAPTDPGSQQRMASILALIDRTRQMADAEYQSSRADLAMQIWAQRAGMGDSDPAATSESIDELLDRYFLSPRMIGAMRARLEQVR
jgi:hypothetical protein